MPREMVLQAEILGINAAFTIPVDSDNLDEEIDRYSDALRRMRAREELRFHYVDLLAALRAEKDFPKNRADYIKRRTDERVRERASWAAAFNAARPHARVDFSETAQQRQRLQEFDTETEKKLAEMDAAYEEFPEKIESLKASIARLHRRVEGESELTALAQEVAELGRPLAAE